MSTLAGAPRLFVGLAVPAHAREALAAELTVLAALDAQVRWTALEQAHLTLKFIGMLDDARTAAMQTSLRAVPWPGPIRLRLVGLSRFPSRGPARVVWAGVGGDTELVVALARELDAALEPLGIPREARAFTAHLTLGRVRGPRNLRALEAALLARSSSFDVALEPIVRATLYASERHVDGSRYRIVEEFALR